MSIPRRINQCFSQQLNFRSIIYKLLNFCQFFCLKIATTATPSCYLYISQRQTIIYDYFRTLEARCLVFIHMIVLDNNYESADHDQMRSRGRSWSRDTPRGVRGRGPRRSRVQRRRGQEERVLRPNMQRSSKQTRWT